MGKFDKDSLKARMNKYEEVYKQQLVPKMPIVMRIDGKAFHTFTKNMAKPFDDLLIDAMQRTMVALCKDIQGAKFGYTQSDEITIVCTIDDVVKSQQYFDGRVQKILSITASKATKYFNRYFYENVQKIDSFNNVAGRNVYEKKLFEAEFDCRVFNLPDYEIVNNLIWRQQDAVRNSIQALAQAYFPSKQLDHKSTSEQMDMLMQTHGVNWNDYPPHKKRGSCCYKKEGSGWYLDTSMPIITEDRGFFEDMFKVKED